MAVHIAILKPPYIRQILAGFKTVESRLTRTRQAPFGEINTGERIYFKASGGAFAAMAIARDIESFENPTPDEFTALEENFRPLVGGDDAYWQSKRTAAYLTFIHLAAVEPIDVGPSYPKSAWKAWHVVSDDADPVRDIALTAGALRNNYLTVTQASDQMKQSTIGLLMPDGQCITTELVNSNRIKYRGWRRYYQAAQLQPGDCVRLVRVAPQRYRVHLIRKPEMPVHD